MTFTSQKYKYKYYLQFDIHTLHVYIVKIFLIVAYHVHNNIATSNFLQKYYNLQTPGKIGCLTIVVINAQNT